MCSVLGVIRSITIKTVQSKKLELSSGLGGEWWRAESAILTRDYFRVEDEAGLRFWLYRDGLYDREIPQEEGRAVQPNWFMHGLFA